MMNKMTKGALSIGIGAALLLGGGGTLAVWNAEATVAPGTIAAGDLNIEANAGIWTNAAGKEIAIGSYKVVPGDVLTYTQPMKLTLTGDQMMAELKFATTGATTGFSATNPEPVVTLSATDAKGVPVAFDPAKLTPASVAAANNTVTAKAVFTFSKDTADRVDVNKTLNLGTTKFTLTQVVK